MSNAPADRLSLKPDLTVATERWRAFWAGEMLDRPPVVITCPAEGVEPAPRPTYRQMLFDPLDEVVAAADAYVRSIHWGGDAVPQFSPGFGPDTFAAFLGAEIEFSREQEDNTSWAVPFVEHWEDVLPLQIAENGYWTRMRELIRRLAEVGEEHLLVHDAHRDDPGLAFMLSRLSHTPQGPTPIGVFRDVQRPVYGFELQGQIDDAIERHGPGDLQELIAGGDTWEV